MVSAIIRNLSDIKKSCVLLRSLQRLQSTKSYKNPIENISIPYPAWKAKANSEAFQLPNHSHAPACFSWDPASRLAEQQIHEYIQAVWLELQNADSSYFGSALAICVPLFSSESFFRSSLVRCCRITFFFFSQPYLALSPFLPDIIASLLFFQLFSFLIKLISIHFLGTRISMDPGSWESVPPNESISRKPARNTG